MTKTPSVREHRWSYFITVAAVTPRAGGQAVTAAFLELKLSHNSNILAFRSIRLA